MGAIRGCLTPHAPGEGLTGISSGYTVIIMKVLVSMPDELLDAIDAAVDRRGTTRSAFFQAAARDALAIPDAALVRAAVERGREAIARLGAFDSVDLIRTDRDAHDAADRRR